MEETEDKKNKEDLQESELLRLQREKYEKIIEDKNKIIKDLLNDGNKTEKKQDEEDEDEEDKTKQLEEERRKKRVAYYKKYIR